MNHYETLGVSRDATSKEIKKAYQRAAKYTHPDHGGNEENFKKAKEAYETLYDPVKREIYDRTLPEILSIENPVTPPIEKQPKEIKEKGDVSAGFFETLFTSFLIIFILVTLCVLILNGVSKTSVGIKPFVRGSVEDPSMVDFYGEMKLRTELGCKYNYPGVVGDPGEDPNVGCLQVPKYKKILKP